MLRGPVTDFQPRLYVTLNRNREGDETLRAAFLPEDCKGDVGVYELVAVARARVVGAVPPIEQLRRFDGEVSR